MAYIKGVLPNGTAVFLTEGGCWVDIKNPLAKDFAPDEAARRLRINNANNRFLDREDRIEATLLESF